MLMDEPGFGMGGPPMDRPMLREGPGYDRWAHSRHTVRCGDAVCISVMLSVPWRGSAVMEQVYAECIPAAATAAAAAGPSAGTAPARQAPLIPPRPLPPALHYLSNINCPRSQQYPHRRCAVGFIMLQSLKYYVASAPCAVLSTLQGPRWGF